MLYGKMGPVIEEWFDDLKQPGTQAEIHLFMVFNPRRGRLFLLRPIVGP